MTPTNDISDESSTDLIRRCYRFAQSLCRDSDLAEELVQDAWVSMLQANGSQTFGYLAAAIRSRYVDHGRKRRNIHLHSECPDELPSLNATSES
ncbi:MAG: DNA-directed RNA polymerase specialized sigma24 family protein, partial [Myxococcota bacterium]